MAGDPAAGRETFYDWCAACHYADAGFPSLNAPNLFGVFGRKVGQLSDFAYTEEVLKSGVVWTEAVLDRWIENPVAMIPGTTMTFIGLPNPAERANVIAFLKQNR